MTNEITRWQQFQMDKMTAILPVGTQPATGSVQCQPYGEVYVLASDHDAEIERLKAAMTGWTSYAWKDKCYVDDVQEYFDSVLKGIAPISLEGIGYSAELLEELEKKR